MTDVGFATLTITPDLPIEVAGLAKRMATKIGGVLSLSAVVIGASDDERIILSIDTLYVDAALQIRIARLAGVDVDRLFVAASHTHCAPIIIRSYVAPVAIEETYIDRVVNAATEAICKARTARHAVRVGYGTATTQVSINRRHRRINISSVRKRPHKPWTWQSILNRPNPEGPSDSTVRVITLTAQECGHRPIWIVVAACHPSIVREPIIDPDFVAPLRDSLAAEADLIFLQGCSGDSRVAILAREAFSLLPGGLARWAVDRVRFEKKTTRIHAAEIGKMLGTAARAAARAAVVPSTNSPAFKARACRHAVKLRDTNGTAVTLALHRLDVAPGLALLGFGAEVFTRYAKMTVIKGKSHGLDVIPVSCAGGMLGYLPDRAALTERLSSYECDRSRHAFGLQARLRPETETDVAQSIAEIVALNGANQ